MRTFLYLAILIIITGCTYSQLPINRSLDEAGAMIQTDPTAALERLNQYDVSEFEDSATMARWALLYSEAMVANNLTAPTDTIVNIAIRYYDSHRLKDEFQYASRLKALLFTAGESDALATALYLQKEKEYMLYKERLKREELFFTFLIVLLVAAGVIVWQRQRIKLKDARNEALMAEASSLMLGLSKNESLCSDLQQKLKTVFLNRFDVIDRLCETYYESHGTKTEKKAIVERVKSQIEELKSDNGLFTEMESCVNECNDSLLINLKEEMPSIKPEEYRLMVYLACHLSNRSIAALLEENIDVVYKRKSRLKAKISALDTPHSASFLAVFQS